MAINRKLSDEQIEKILDSYWNFERVKDTADSAGVSRVTVTYFWKTDVLKAYYKSEKLPENPPIQTAFGSGKLPLELSFEEIYERVNRCLLSRSAFGARIREQLFLLTEFGYFKKIELPKGIKYTKRRKTQILE